MKSQKWFAQHKAWKWLLPGLAAAIAIQFYFVEEMLAALLLFSILFAVVALLVLMVFLVDRASQRTLTWAQPQGKRIAQLSRRVLELGEAFNRKLHHRPHSQTAR